VAVSGQIADRALTVLKYGFVALGFLLAFLLFFHPAENPDFFWHFSAGRYIVHNLAFPHSDFLSWSRAGAPWVDFEWLPQVLYYLLYSHGGLWPVYSLKILLLSLSLWIFVRHMKMYGAGQWLFFLVPLWAVALLPNLDIRPENFTMLFFTLEFYLLERIRLGLLKPSLPAAAGITALLFALWGNTHAGYFYGAALAFFFCAGELVRVALPLAYGKPRTENFDTAMLYAVITAAAVLAPLVNPYGIGVYRVTLEHYRDMAVLEQYILEWQMPSIYSLSQLPYWLVLGAGLGVMLWRALKYRDTVAAHLLALGCFGIVSSQHSRMTMFGVMIALPCSVYALRQTRLSDRAEKIILQVLTVLFIAVVLQVRMWAQASLGREPWKYSITAEGAASFLEQNKDRLSGLRMYNPWGWGGYMGYRLYPDYRIFQDGRYIFHPNLAEIFEAEGDNGQWQKFVRKHDFQLVVMERINGVLSPFKMTTSAGKTSVVRRPYYLFYMPKQGWSLVYWNAYALVFVRNDSADPQWLAENRFVTVRPEDMEAVMTAFNAGDVSQSQLTGEFRLLTRDLTETGSLVETEREFNFWKDLCSKIKSQPETTHAAQSQL
jgi:hypothetical protein